MRARLIYEKFEKESDPIRDLNIGMFKKKIDFKSDEEAADFVISVLHLILKRKKIPRDILGTNILGINNKYGRLIFDYRDEYITVNGEETGSMFSLLVSKLRELGFKESIFEKFTADSDPVRDLGIGVLSKIKDAVKTSKDPENYKFDYENGEIVCEWKGYIPNYVGFDLGRSAIKLNIVNIVKRAGFRCKVDHTGTTPYIDPQHAKFRFKINILSSFRTSK